MMNATQAMANSTQGADTSGRLRTRPTTTATAVAIPTRAIGTAERSLSRSRTSATAIVAPKPQ